MFELENILTAIERPRLRSLLHIDLSKRVEKKPTTRVALIVIVVRVFGIHISLSKRYKTNTGLRARVLSRFAVYSLKNGDKFLAVNNERV